VSALAHIDVDVRVVLGGDAPMHSNSFTPMQISGTPRSFLTSDSRRRTSTRAVVMVGVCHSPRPVRGGLFGEQCVLVG